MTALPLHDRDGNVLIDIRHPRESELGRLAEEIALPASLVVVTHADSVLMMFDSRRRHWELPGGMRDNDETPREAALRELLEETGVHAADLTFAAVAEFVLRRPSRRELLAIYALRLRIRPSPTVNDEALAFRWWPPRSAVPGDMSPLDAEIARRVVGEP